MANDVGCDWMWSEACETLARIERLQREFFRPIKLATQQLAWEPPADILETEHEVLVLVALPGVDAEMVETIIEEGHLVIGGTRILPPELRMATIHRLELPQGRFQRRLALPPGSYSGLHRAVVHGCLLITLHKAGNFSG
jgi:HSP20 family molecular chaperone IbpA